MNREEATKRSEEALDELALALEQGKSEVLVQYLATLARFHNYSFGNCMLIALQKPDATLVAGYRRWQELRRQVKQGEHGIAILAPMKRRRKAEAEKGGDEEQEEEDDPKAKTVFGYRVVHVFDVSQTEGAELPEFATVTGEPGEKLARLEEIVRGKGIELRYDAIPGGALGISEGGKITVLPTLSKAESFSVLVHELAHELLHRGDRRKDNGAGDESVLIGMARRIDTQTGNGDRGNAQLQHGEVHVAVLVGDHPVAFFRDVCQDGCPRRFLHGRQVVQHVVEPRPLEHARMPADDDPARGRAPWRDTMVAVRGPGAAALDRAFGRVWRLAGPPLPPDELAVDPPPQGRATVRIVEGEPGAGRIYRTVQILAAAAVDRLWITDAYLVAPPAVFASLVDAARDGVDVRLLVPGASDLPVLRNVTRTGYRDLLRAGG